MRRAINRKRYNNYTATNICRTDSDILVINHITSNCTIKYGCRKLLCNILNRKNVSHLQVNSVALKFEASGKSGGITKEDRGGCQVLLKPSVP